MDNIVIKRYGSEEEEEVSAYLVGKCATSQNMADILDEYCNCGMKDYRDGLIVGRLCQNKHRTIQASIIRFCLGVIVGLSGVEYTDARNETPVKMGKKIESMIKSGDLIMGYMI
jgi:hypothetical protein